MLQEEDALGSPHLGTATILVSELLTGEVITGWQNLKHKTGRGVSFGKASIRVTLQYVPVTKACSLTNHYICSEGTHFPVSNWLTIRAGQFAEPGRHGWQQQLGLPSRAH